MVVQHNIPAINSHRNLGINNTNLSKNLEKLSSGYRINRAADDAAGLAISEKMRAQITGLNRAVMNARDGSSLIQTAEGALQEVHGMLNRMVELATQSANGTIQADDRQKIEAEVEALKGEIDRISESTNFNGIKLLDGSLSTKASKDITVKGFQLEESVAKANKTEQTTAIAQLTDALADGDTVEFTFALDNNESYTLKFTYDKANKLLVAEDGTKYKSTDANFKPTEAELGAAVKGELAKTKLKDKFTIAYTGGKFTFTAKELGTTPPQVVDIKQVARKGVDGSIIANNTKDLGATMTAGEDVTYTYNAANFTVFERAAGTEGNEADAVFEVNGYKFAFAKDDTNVQELIDKGVTIVKTGDGTIKDADVATMAAQINQKTGLSLTSAGTTITFAAPKSGNGLVMQVGDTADDYQKITVSVDDMSSNGLGISSISMATQESAAASLDAIKSAIEKVSINRGNLGALQNRLEYTINNLNVASENMTAAESRVRDVDMAKEMMAFTKNNVLSQAAQAMLAQANQQPQQVLQLLR